jgi:hypothetical protein
MKRERESRSCLQTSCNCQYNCHEASVLGPTWIASPVLFASKNIRIILFSCVCQFGIFPHHITYVIRPKCTNSFFSFGLFIYFPLPTSQALMFFLRLCVSCFLHGLLISLQKHIPWFLVQVHRVLINSVDKAVLLAWWGWIYEYISVYLWLEVKRNSSNLISEICM